MEQPLDFKCIVNKGLYKFVGKSRGLSRQVSQLPLRRFVAHPNVMENAVDFDPLPAFEEMVFAAIPVHLIIGVLPAGVRSSMGRIRF